MICSRYENGKCASTWCYYKSAGNTCLNPRLKRNHRNADRIRGMSDDAELAAEILLIVHELFDEGIPSKEELIAWLQQPAKEEV